MLTAWQRKREHHTPSTHNAAYCTPEVLNGLISNNTFRGRGLTARFLYSMPKSAIGTRAFQATPIPEKAKQGYTSLVKSLLAEEASNEPIELSSGASEILETLFYEVEGRLRNLG